MKRLICILLALLLMMSFGSAAVLAEGIGSDSAEQAAMMEKLIDIMEDDDDVQNIWHNWEE